MKSSGSSKMNDRQQTMENVIRNAPPPAKTGFRPWSTISPELVKTNCKRPRRSVAASLSQRDDTDQEDAPTPAPKRSRKGSSKPSGAPAYDSDKRSAPRDVKLLRKLPPVVVELTDSSDVDVSDTVLDIDMDENRSLVSSKTIARAHSNRAARDVHSTKSVRSLAAKQELYKAYEDIFRMSGNLVLRVQKTWSLFGALAATKPGAGCIFAALQDMKRSSLGCRKATDSLKGYTVKILEIVGKNTEGKPQALPPPSAERGAVAHWSNIVADLHDAMKRSRDLARQIDEQSDVCLLFTEEQGFSLPTLVAHAGNFTVLVELIVMAIDSALHAMTWLESHLSEQRRVTPA